MADGDPGVGGHDTHDPLLIAALLDRDAAGPERAAAEAMIVACPGCARLHRDLLALAQAERVLPLPGRPRDFALTAADATRLTTVGTAGEPGTPVTRLTGVMHVLPATSDHARHDTATVASLADRTLDPTERAAAEALVAACDRCAELHADLVTLAVAMKAMPTPARARDYTLTAADAARLRGSLWRRLVGVFGSPRDALSRPLAIGLTTLGIAGLLVASVPSFSPGSATSAGAPVSAGASAAPPAQILGDRAASTTQPNATGGTGAVSVPDTASAPEAASSGAPNYGQNQGPSAAAGIAAPAATGSAKGADAGAGEAGSTPTDQRLSATAPVVVAPTGIAPLPLLSLTVLGVGLLLFTVRWAARRLKAH